MSQEEPTPELDADKVQSEEQLMFGYGGKDRQPVELLSDYLPEKEDYGAKTVLTPEQVHLLAALEQLTTFFDEVEEYDEVIEQWIRSYEKRMTSAHGLSRQEFLEILVAMQGGSTDNSSQRGILEKMLSTDMEDDGE
jgi:hypothetical protein